MMGIPDFNHILKRIPNGRLFPTGAFKLLFGRSRPRSIRIMTLGVKRKFRGRGIFALFSHEAWQRASNANLLGAEASWILEDNEEMNRPWVEAGARVYRRWRYYERAL